MTPDSYPLEREHYFAFGSIVHSFARFERLLEVAIHGIVDTKSFALTALTISALGYQQKVDLLNALLKSHPTTEFDADIVAMYMREFNEFLNLRNLISHNVWTRGDRRGSIKAVKITARGGTQRIHGITDGETDYTISELTSIAEQLEYKRAAFAAYLDFANEPPLLENSFSDL